ncbi:uncharacterized protein LOC141617317 [Silene latifolia]|uniref:uncharacterized protein LOC141617317 n=1 Tax=Silene latifolia TaxID=37657 RepID=UPI003D76F1ED
MCDIHSGDCGNHTGGRSLSNKTLRQDYFWPTMRKDAIDYVKKCEKCQRAYMLAMTDYFSKWIEAEVFPHIQEKSTPKVVTGQTPFSLVYGAEAIIPSEVQVLTHGYANATEERNQVEMASSLDTIDEPRTSAQIRMTAYKQTAARSYNKNLRLRTLQVGDLVLRKVFPNTKNQSAGKFAYNWEGPYRIEGIMGNGAYKLLTMDGEAFPRSWNIIHIKTYYV